jgi:hypothetical protein
MAAIKNDTFVGIGSVMLDLWDDNDNPTGLVPISGSQMLSFTQKTKTLTDTSKAAENEGQITAAITMPEITDVKWKVKGFDKNKMALTMLGRDVALTHGGGTVTAEPMTAKLGVMQPFPRPVGIAAGSAINVTAKSVVVTNTAATTTYAEGTDYRINYAGYLMALESGAITEGQALKVTYTHGAVSGYRIAGNTVAQKKGEFIWDGINKADGRKCRFRQPLTILTPTGNFDLMSDKTSEMDFDMFPVLLDGEESNYYFEYY